MISLLLNLIFVQNIHYFPAQKTNEQNKITSIQFAVKGNIS